MNTSHMCRYVTEDIPSSSPMLTQRVAGSPTVAEALGRFSKKNSNCSVPSPIESSVILKAMQNRPPESIAGTVKVKGVNML